MGKIQNFIATVAALVLVIGSAYTQSAPHRTSPLWDTRTRPTRQVSSADDRCGLNGTYRIDVTDSDGLYSAVKNAKSRVPFGDQQQFFMDLSTRLTPPDMLAIECRGRSVSVGSSRSAKITYLADGKNRRERVPDRALAGNG